MNRAAKKLAGIREISVKPMAAHVRDATGIAKAWGLRLYDAKMRGLLLKQLDAVRAAMATPGFPQKIKGKGYDRAAVVQWGMAHLDIAKGERTFAVVEKGKTLNPERRTSNLESPSGARTAALIQGSKFKVQSSTVSGELPPQETPAGEGELFDVVSMDEAARREAIISKLPPPYQTRYRELLEMHDHPNPVEGGKTLTEKQLQDLIDLGLVKRGAALIGLIAAPEESSINIPGGQKGVANWIRNNFPGLNPTHADISDWIKGERLNFLPNPCTENFPGADIGGRYKSADVRAWVEKYLVNKTGQAGMTLPMLHDRQRKEKADADLAEMAAETERKRTSGLYVLTATAERTGTAIGIAVRTLTREALERAVPKRFGEKVSGFRFQVSGEAAPMSLPVEAAAALKELLLADCVAVFTDWQRQSQARIGELLAQTKANIEP